MKKTLLTAISVASMLCTLVGCATTDDLELYNVDDGQAVIVAKEEWLVEMDPRANFEQYTYFDGDADETADIFIEGHGGDDTTPYPAVLVKKSDETLVFPKPADYITDDVLIVTTWGDYEERETGEEIKDKPVFEVIEDGDVYDIKAYEYLTGETSTGDRLCIRCYNRNSNIKNFELFGEKITSDAVVHVRYGKESVTISADQPIDLKISIDNSAGNTAFEKDITISETPLTLSRKGLKYVIE